MTICESSTTPLRLLLNVDRVIFFNLGHHHVPHSGDIPNTLMHTSASSVMFTPFNFHDSDPTRLSAQGVRIDTEDETTKVRYYGGRYHDGVSLKAVRSGFPTQT